MATRRHLHMPDTLDALDDESGDFFAEQDSSDDELQIDSEGSDSGGSDSAVVEAPESDDAASDRDVSASSSASKRRRHMTTRGRGWLREARRLLYRALGGTVVPLESQWLQL